MGDFAGFVDKNAVIGAHATVDHANIWGDERDLRERRRVDEWRGRLFFSSENDAICRFVRYEHDAFD